MPLPSDDKYSFVVFFHFMNCMYSEVDANHWEKGDLGLTYVDRHAPCMDTDTHTNTTMIWTGLLSVKSAP